MVISINYNEPNPASYKNVNLYYSDEKEILFDSGNFCKDWFQAIREVILNNDHTGLNYSSSIDSFFIDGADEIYDVITIPDTFIPIYIPKGSKMNWEKCKKLWND